MNEETRDIIKVILDDNNEVESKEIDKILFGPNVDLRKSFIQENLSNFIEV